MEKLNPAQILTGFIWNDEVQEILKLEMNKEGKVTVNQDSQVKYVMAFQDFLDHCEKKAKGV